MNFCHECRHCGSSWLWWYDYCAKTRKMIPLKRGGVNEKTCAEFDRK